MNNALSEVSDRLCQEHTRKAVLVSYHDRGSWGGTFSQRQGGKENGLPGSPQIPIRGCELPVLLSRSRHSGGWKDPQTLGLGDCLGPIVDTQLAVYVARVRLDRMQ